jgi:hypothetical protein
MDDQRIIRRPLFGLVDASDGIRPSRVCTKAVGYLGRERDWDRRLTKCRSCTDEVLGLRRILDNQFLETMR